MNFPFKLPVRIEDRYFLVDANSELISDMPSATSGEMEAIVKRINAYDELKVELSRFVEYLAVASQPDHGDTNPYDEDFARVAALMEKLK